MGKIMVVRLGVTAAALQSAGADSCKKAAQLALDNLPKPGEYNGEMEEDDEVCDKDCECGECGECDECEEDDDDEYVDELELDDEEFGVDTDSSEEEGDDQTLSVFVIGKGGTVEIIMSTEVDEPWKHKDGKNDEIEVDYTKIVQWYEL